MTDWLSPFRRLRGTVCNWFALTRAEAASLMLVLGILLLGLAAKLFIK